MPGRYIPGRGEVLEDRNDRLFGTGDAAACRTLLGFLELARNVPGAGRREVRIDRDDWVSEQVMPGRYIPGRGEVLEDRNDRLFGTGDAAARRTVLGFLELARNVPGWGEVGAGRAGVGVNLRIV